MITTHASSFDSNLFMSFQLSAAGQLSTLSLPLPARANRNRPRLPQGGTDGATPSTVIWECAAASEANRGVPEIIVQ